MTESGNLTSRQGLLLKLIVREHVEATVPVGSRTLVEKYNLGFSPATVRNEKAQLEDVEDLLAHGRGARAPRGVRKPRSAGGSTRS